MRPEWGPTETIQSRGQSKNQSFSWCFFPTRLPLHFFGQLTAQNWLNCAGKQPIWSTTQPWRLRRNYERTRRSWPNMKLKLKVNFSRFFFLRWTAYIVDSRTLIPNQCTATHNVVSPFSPAWAFQLVSIVTSCKSAQCVCSWSVKYHYGIFSLMWLWHERLQLF